MEPFVMDSIIVSLVLHVGQSLPIIDGDIVTLASHTQTEFQFERSSKTLTIKGTWSNVSVARLLFRAVAHVSLAFQYRIRDLETGRFLTTISEQREIQQIQYMFNVSITYKYRQIRVTGPCYNEDNILTVVKILLKHFHGHHHHHIPILTEVELSPEHHDFVQGRYNENVVRIAHDTSSHIQFPDQVNTENVRLGAHSTISISGARMYGVIMARKRLIDSFPITLIYDCTNDSPFIGNLDAMFCASSHYSVFITKDDSFKKEIIIKGVENHLENACLALNDLICIGRLLNNSGTMAPIMPNIYENTNGTSQSNLPNIYENTNGASQSNVTNRLTDQNFNSNVPRSNPSRGRYRRRRKK